VCHRYLPPAVLKRKKRGFAVNVVDHWFRSSVGGALPEMLLDDRSLMFNLLEPAPVRQLVEGHRSGKEDSHKLLFSLVMFEQWLRQMHSSHQSSMLTSVN
jgi:asparagine synthase (glutamine-hydrolysing)